MLTVGSVCSGLGGFDYAFERQGFTVKWQVEIDKNCQKLLKAKYPHAELHTDLTKFKPKDSDAVSVIVGGTPCQNLSVAGQREGLDGDRSRIFFDMVRLCKKLRPRIIEWENVPGALSSNEGRDFARVIRAFTGLKVEIPREGWANAGFVRTPYPGGRWNIAWRVLDAQYFGVAQRRKRLFLIGSLGNASCLQILFEPESVCGDNPPSREKRERTTAEFESSTNGGGGALANPLGAHHPRMDLDNETYVANVCPTIGCVSNGGGANGPGRTVDDCESLIVGAVSSKWSKGTGGPAGDECYNLVAHTLRAEHDASEDGTGRGTPLVAIPIQEIGKRQSGGEREGVGHGKAGDPMFSLQASAQHGVMTSVSCLTLESLTVVGFVEIIKSYAAETKISADKILSVLQLLNDPEKVFQWSAGIGIPFQAQDVLQHEVLCGGFCKADELEYIKDQQRETPGEAPETKGSMREVRQTECQRRSPQRQEYKQQSVGEFGKDLSKLSHPGTSGEEVLQNLQTTSEGVGLLRNALLSIQKVGRSAIGERQSIHTTEKRQRPESFSQMPGLREENACTGLLRKVLYETEEGGNIKRERSIGVSPVVRRLTPL